LKPSFLDCQKCDCRINSTALWMRPATRSGFLMSFLPRFHSYSYKFDCIQSCLWCPFVYIITNDILKSDFWLEERDDFFFEKSRVAFFQSNGLFQTLFLKIKKSVFRTKYIMEVLERALSQGPDIKTPLVMSFPLEVAIHFSPLAAFWC